MKNLQRNKAQKGAYPLWGDIVEIERKTLTVSYKIKISVLKGCSVLTNKHRKLFMITEAVSSSSGEHMCQVYEAKANGTRTDFISFILFFSYIHKAPGADGIPGEVLKMGGTE